MNLLEQVKNRFNISNILKELLLRVKKLESGNSTGNFIPLSGTTEGNPVNGNLEFLYDGNWKKIYSKNIDGEEFGLAINTEENCVTIYKIFSDNTSVFNRFGSSDLNYYATFGVGYKEIEINADFGIIALEDYSLFSPESKLIYAQRSYVEKPQTLINALNNCDATQLTTIKGILGIT